MVSTNFVNKTAYIYNTYMYSLQTYSTYDDMTAVMLTYDYKVSYGGIRMQTADYVHILDGMYKGVLE